MPLYPLLLHLAQLLPEADDQAEQLVQIEEALHWMYADTAREHELSIAEAYALAKDTDEWETKLLKALLS
ncbi:MAG: hypothetical protein AAGJ10_13870 [Bacteroidota bacterium]